MKTLLPARMPPFLMKKRSFDLFWFKTVALAISIVIATALVFAQVYHARTERGQFVNFRAASLSQLATSSSPTSLGLTANTPLFYFTHEKVIVGRVSAMTYPKPQDSFAILNRNTWVKDLQEKILREDALKKILDEPTVSLSFENNEPFSSTAVIVTSVQKILGERSFVLLHAVDTAEERR